MRFPVASDLKTRTSAPDEKDARLKNAYVEVKGEQTAVRKRAASTSALSLGTGTAQGCVYQNGILVCFNGDTLELVTVANSLPSTQDFGTIYYSGPFETSPTPPANTSVTNGYAYGYGGAINKTVTKTYTIRQVSGAVVITRINPYNDNESYTIHIGGTLVSSGSGTDIVYGGGAGGAPPAAYREFNNYLYTESDIQSLKNTYPNAVSYIAGHSWYLVNGILNYYWTGSSWNPDGTGNVTGTILPFQNSPVYYIDIHEVWTYSWA